MTVQTKLPSALFPDIPREHKIVNEHGHLSPIWQRNLSSLYQGLQNNFSNEGFQLPQLSGDQINTIAAKYQQYVGAPLPPGVKNISGTKVYDYTNTAEKTFIITFATPGDSSTNVATAGWKTVTLT